MIIHFDSLKLLLGEAGLPELGCGDVFKSKRE